MKYGDIIKRAWHVTWRYKALWVLGIFAGVSGCQASGGGGNNYNFGSDRGNRFGSTDFSRDFPALRSLLSNVERILPVLIAVVVLTLLVAFIFAVLGIAARGGLIVGASAHEDGRRPRLKELWGTGFDRFWPLLGLTLLLRLPVFVLSVGLALAVAVPLIGGAMAGREPNWTSIAPVCGGLAIGVPILILLSFVLDLMYLIGTRYLMLGGQRAVESAGNAWRFVRARFKDTFFLWLINAGLNLVASFVMAIPIIIVGIAVGIPMVAVAAADQWAAFAGLAAVLIGLMILVSFIYSAIWGTFTSALWTYFFRDVTGMRVVGAPAPSYDFSGATPPSYGQQPGQAAQHPGYAPQQPGYAPPPPGPSAPTTPTPDYSPGPQQPVGPPDPPTPPSSDDSLGGPSAPTPPSHG